MIAGNYPGRITLRIFNGAGMRLPDALLILRRIPV
jgi:hypothetical protein